MAQNHATQSSRPERLSLLSRFSRMKTRWLIVFIFLLTLGSSACDQLVYSPDELAAKNRYLSVPLEITISGLEDLLGSPLIEVLIDKNGQPTNLPALSGQTDQKRDRFATKTLADALQFMPGGQGYEKVLIYSEATVFAYFFIGKSGKVKKTEIVTTQVGGMPRAFDLAWTNFQILTA